jgi:hypothetical protein
LEGTIDLLFAYYQSVVGIHLPPGSLGATFYIPTVIVPPLLVTHLAMYRLLLRAPPKIAEVNLNSGVPG